MSLLIQLLAALAVIAFPFACAALVAFVVSCFLPRESMRFDR